MDVKELTLDGWADRLPNTGFEEFHTPEALTVIDDYAKGDLRLYGGFRGEQPVALLPVFVRYQFGLKFVLSPPPGLSVPQLGPILMPTSPKQRKRERLNNKFTTEVLNELDAETPRTLFGMVASPRYTDPRPYLSAGFGVVPRFAYRLDLEDRDEDEVLDSFTSDLRREVRKGDDLDVSIQRGGIAEAEHICDDLKRRHTEQGLTFPTPRSFAGDLVQRLEDRARVYVARDPDGEYLSGITVLYSEESGRFWQGGIKANYEGVSVNSLLHWKIIEDILRDPELRDVHQYNLGNVNNLRISRYKSKFNADLIPNYEIKSDLMAIAKKGYSVRRHLPI